jgi:hypothetical protein
VPNGRVGWQAVIAYISKRSPLAVFRPLNTPPYQEATPWSAWVVELSAGVAGASVTGVVLAIGATGGAVTTGWDSRASACTVRGVTATTPATSKTEEVPAASQIRSEVFAFTLLDFLLFSICLFYQFVTI